MTQEEILRKAIERAEKNGYEIPYEPYLWYEGLNNFAPDSGLSMEAIIFDHEFAQAFWGEKEFCFSCERHHERVVDCDCGTGNDAQEWQVRLRQMVISDDPIEYLAQFLKEE